MSVTTTQADRQRAEGGLTAVIYLRVSSVGQLTGASRDGYSIDAQREVCQRHAERLGATVIREYVEPGKTATGDALKRPALRRLLAELGETRPDFVIFYDLSRSAREEFDAFWLLREITSHGAKLESTQERIDDTPEGMLQFAIMSGVNAFRSRNDGKKVKLGLDRKHAEGGTIGPARIGYLNTAEEVGGRKIASIALDPVRAPLVRMAFDLILSGQQTISSVTELLEQAGLTQRPTPGRPGRPLGRSSVHRLLTCDYYTGVVTRNGVTVPGRHEAIVTPEEFERVQAALASHRVGDSRGRKHKHYLSGQLTCTCGRRYGYGRHRGKLGHHYEYYSCLSRVQPSGPCGARYVRLEEIEDKLDAIHQRDWLTPQERAAVREALQKSISAKTKVARDEHDRHTRRLTELKRQHKKLLDLYYKDGVSLETMREEQERIDRETADVKRWQATAELQERDVMNELEVALAVIDRAHHPYDELPEAQRRLLNSAIFDDFLITEADDGSTITPRYEATYVALRDVADAVMTSQNGSQPDAASPRRSGGVQARVRAENETNPGPLSLGQGSHNGNMAEREGFEPSVDR